MANNILDDITEQIDKIVVGVTEMGQQHEQLNTNIDKLELEQDLLDHWLRKLADEDDAQGLLEFTQAYLGYRESMNVKDAVENVVEEQNLEEASETEAEKD